MNRYTIPCTAEQTKGAMELGAPISKVPFCPVIRYEQPWYYTDKDFAYSIPTAEQMIGWLETQGIREVSLHHLKDVWHICIYLDNGDITHTEKFYLSRKEATLAAIDAALDYLIQNKK